MLSTRFFSSLSSYFSSPEEEPLPQKEDTQSLLAQMKSRIYDWLFSSDRENSSLFNQIIAKKIPAIKKSRINIREQKNYIYFSFEDQEFRQKKRDPSPPLHTLKELLHKHSSSEMYQVSDYRNRRKRRNFYLFKQREDGLYKKVTNWKSLCRQIRMRYGDCWKSVDSTNHHEKYYFAEELSSKTEFIQIPPDKFIKFFNERARSRKPLFSFGNENSRRAKIVGGIGAIAAFFGSQTGSPLSSALQIGGSHTMGGWALGAGTFSLCFDGVAGNSAPTVIKPAEEFSLFPGESASIHVNDYFQDPNRDSLIFEFNRPSFVATTVFPFSLIGEFFSGGPFSNAQIEGNLLHLFGDGLYQIWDIANATSPQMITNYTDYSSSRGIVKGNFTYVVTDRVQVLDMTDPTSPSFAGEFVSSWTANVGSHTNMLADPSRPILWLGEGRYFHAIDVSNPSTISEIANISTVNPGNSVQAPALTEDLRFLLGQTNGVSVQIHNVSNLANISLEGTSTVPFEPTQMLEKDRIVFSVHEILSFVQMSNLTDNSNLNFIDALPSGGCRIFLNGPYFFLADCIGSGTERLTIYDKRDLRQFPRYIDQINGIGPFQVQENYLFEHDSATQNLRVHEFHHVRVDLNPQTNARGSHELQVTADDGLGGRTTIMFPINVMNRPPYVQTPINDTTAWVNQLFSLTIDPLTMFGDPENDLLQITTGPLPGWLSFQNRTGVFLGAPNLQDIGSTTIQVIATDSFGDNATETFLLQVLILTGTTGGTSSTASTFFPSSFPSSETTETISSTGGGTVLAVLFTTLGIVCLVATCGGVGYVVWRRKKQLEMRDSSIELAASSRESTFEMSSKTKDNIDRVIGETPNLYGYLKLTPEERKAIYQETKTLVPFTGILGRGQFGSITPFWSFEHSKYVVGKTIEGEKEIQQSQNEAAIQRKAAGEGVWPILNTVPDTDKLIHFMDMAPRDALSLGKAAQNLGDKEMVPLFALYLVHDILRGLMTIHGKNIYHLDLKGSNVLLSQEGVAKITDFGCALEEKNRQFKPGDSDWRYKSVQRKTEDSIDGVKEDAWAVGLIALESLLQRPIEDFLHAVNTRKVNTVQELQNQYIHGLDSIEELRNPDEGSIWSVTKGLLALDENERPSPEEALRSSCFQSISDQQRDEIFTRLFSQQSDPFASNDNHAVPDKEGQHTDIEFYESQFYETRVAN